MRESAGLDPCPRVVLLGRIVNLNYIVQKIPRRRVDRSTRHALSGISHAVLQTIQSNCPELTRALARIGRKHIRSSHCLSSSRYVDGIKVLAEQFNQSVSALVLAATETMSPAETLGDRRRRRDARRRLAQRYRQAPAVDQAQQL